MKLDYAAAFSSGVFKVYEQACHGETDSQEDSDDSEPGEEPADDDWRFEGNLSYTGPPGPSPHSFSTFVDHGTSGTFGAVDNRAPHPHDPSRWDPAGAD